MSDMLDAARRGWDLLMREPLPLLLGGLFWTLLCQFTGWVLLGPALFGLFAVALKAHRGERVTVTDNFTAFDDAAPSLVAGIVLVLPLVVLEALDKWVWALVAFIFVHFSYFVYVFAVLADRRCGLAEATHAAVTLADAGGARKGRVSRLALHVAFTSTITVGLVAVASVPVSEFPFLLIVAGPLAVCMLTAWYVQVAYPDAARADDDADLADDDLDPGTASAG